MGVEIPEPFKWDKSFEVFYTNLDEEHKGLFDGIFACCGDNNAANLASLLKRCIDHFATEEAMMDKNNYSEVVGHKAIHKKFIADLTAVAAPLNAEQVHWAKDWLVNHICTNDFKYKGKLG
uniref:Hemerythrin n=1 Tax=Paramphinome jeffreysii TaxID=222009 RepID=A0A1S6QD33_PARJE|nr:hemerythrin [Paramphinome jeffreysii]